MYNTLKILLASLFILGLWSCSDDDSERGELTGSPSGIVLQDSGVPTIAINENTPDYPTLLLTWNDNDGLGAPYSIHMATTEAFENPYEIGTSTTTSFSMTMGELNEALNMAGIPNYSTDPLYFRIVKGDVTSNSISFGVITYPTIPPVITPPNGGTTLVLDETMPDEVAATLEWTDESVAGGSAAVTYEVEAALSGTNFAAPVSAGTVTDMYSIDWSNKDLNDVALAVGIEPNMAGDMDLRVVATIETTTGMIERTSDSITINVTPYQSIYPNMYLVGNATAAGWDPGNNNQPLFINPDTPSEFTFTGYFAAGELKLIETLGAWQPQWGDDGSNSGVLGYNGGSSGDPSGIAVSTAGYYTLTVNRVGTGGTYSLAAYDESGASTYPTMEIIGPAQSGGWGAGTAMTQSTFDDHIWYAQGVTMTEDNFKFRTDGTWAHNWGASTTGLFGIANYGDGGNMTLDVAGTYNVWFNDITGHYVLIAQ